MIKRRNLPHIYPEDSILFITFRLKGSIPQSVLAGMQLEQEEKSREILSSNLSKSQKEEQLYLQEKRFFLRYDQAMERNAKAKDFLKNVQIAKIVANKIHEYDGKYYDLLSYCIMSNHVHLLFHTSEYDTHPSKIMQYIKGGTSYSCNQYLGRKGAFWQKESYDHYVRDAKELENIERYIVKNPVKAGLVTDWEDWEFTYWKT